MKKKHHISLALLLGSLLLFSGCACKHEWTEADCLNPRLCTKCEETQGDSLGHNFLPATCEAPETCSRCGETQGEPLEHSYGDWTAGEEEMTRACEHCGNTESAEIDREILAAQRLEGTWDFVCTVQGGTRIISQASNLSDGVAGTTLSFSEDGSCTLNNGDDTSFMECRWELVECQLLEGSREQYTFHLLTSDGSLPVSLVKDNNGSALALYLEEDLFVLLAQSPLLEAAMEGTWTAAGNSQFYSITLNADRTFTAELNETVSGRWYLTSADFSTEFSFPNRLTLRWETDDGAEGRSFKIQPDSSDPSLVEFIMPERPLYDQTYSTFYKVNEAEVQEAASRLVGEWRSQFLMPDNQTINRRIHTDASFIFREDETFTATLDKTFSGIWKHEATSVMEHLTVYYYNLYPEGGGKSINFWVQDNGELVYPEYDAGSLHFGQLTVEEMEAFEKGFDLLPGTWTATESFTYDEETETDVPYKKGNFSMVISADGRYTAQLGEKTEGSWTYYEYSPDQTRYQYMFVSDADQYQMFALHPDGRLECFYWEGDTCVCIYLEKNG